MDATYEGIIIPAGIANDGKVVLNLAPQAVKDLDITNEHVAFSTRFSSVAEDIYCPMASLLAIYARENGEGMMFPAEEGDDAVETRLEAEEKPRGPTLSD